MRIGGAAAFFGDSAHSVPQLLGARDGLDYLVFDSLSESVMGGLSRQMRADPQAGWARRFVDLQVGPYLKEIAERGIRIVTNAGGLAPGTCAEALRAKVKQLGLSLKVAAVEGDNLTARAEELKGLGLKEMYSAKPIADLMAEADTVLSITAYTGGFPIAQALDDGADIVVCGRAVDSAPTLGALIHEFGWGPDDYDLLAAGTLAGHLLECSTQVSGGAFTDWRDVSDWANLGFPIGACKADGSMVFGKPENSGGLVSVGTVSEQLLYEVSNPGAYFVPDVVCDFSQVKIAQVGPDRVSLSGARGLPRTSTYKVCMTYDLGWKAVTAYPVVGLEAAAKAERLAAALVNRTRELFRQRNLGDWTRTRIEIVGSEAAYGDKAAAASRQAREVVCRVAGEHREKAAVDIFAEECATLITTLVGATMPMQQAAVPMQRLACFLLEKSKAPLEVVTPEGRKPATAPTDGGFRPELVPDPPVPPAPADARTPVPLIGLAWARSGDKGDLFNVAVIARKPEYLPYIAAALTPEAVAEQYGHVFNEGAGRQVERQYAPGINALNFVVREAMGGGLASNLRFDSPGKGLGQQLLSRMIPVSPAIAREVEARVREIEAARAYEGVA
ncbi:acyclic terpene utilization AtuA family protein [Phenylobacterium sp.]|uniref:acyclic terpene utilization AtuA family protein n=1 Tax=Phenylobacterium sp. TaxID=1871053 RepID=UPI002F4127C4